MKSNSNPSHISMFMKIAWYDDIRRSLITLLISMGVMLSIFIIMTFQIRYRYISSAHDAVDPIIDIQQAFFIISLFLLACCGGAMIGHCFSTKPKAISALMLPATQAKKFWLRWTFYVPVFFIAFATCACAVDIIRYIASLMINGNQPLVQLGITRLKFDSDFQGVLSLCIALQSFFVLGGIVWPKRGILLTALTQFIYGWVLVIFATFIAYLLKGYYINPILENFDFNITEDMMHALCCAAMIIIAIVNYTLAYYRTKEMEIIQRW